jgi:hypothetical protein
MAAESASGGSVGAPRISTRPPIEMAVPSSAAARGRSPSSGQAISSAIGTCICTSSTATEAGSACRP